MFSSSLCLFQFAPDAQSMQKVFFFTSTEDGKTMNGCVLSQHTVDVIKTNVSLRVLDAHTDEDRWNREVFVQRIFTSVAFDAKALRRRSTQVVHIHCLRLICYCCCCHFLYHFAKHHFFFINLLRWLVFHFNSWIIFICFSPLTTFVAQISHLLCARRKTVSFLSFAWLFISAFRLLFSFGTFVWILT